MLSMMFILFQLIIVSIKFVLSNNVSTLGVDLFAARLPLIALSGDLYTTYVHTPHHHPNPFYRFSLNLLPL